MLIEIGHDSTFKTPQANFESAHLLTFIEQRGRPGFNSRHGRTPFKTGNFEVPGSTTMYFTFLGIPNFPRARQLSVSFKTVFSEQK